MEKSKIDIVILTKTSDEEHYKLTCNALNSLKQCPEYSRMCIIVVESQKDCTFTYSDCDYIIQYPYECFNYNKALNLAVGCCEGYWHCFCNNDVIFDENWLTSILSVSHTHSDIDSFCPKYTDSQPEIDIGYTCTKQMLGWCFMCKHSVLMKIGMFDEQFDFYFQDDDYIEQLRKHNIKHASIKASIVTHLGQRTTGREDMNKLYSGRDKFIHKYGEQVYQQREFEKNGIEEMQNWYWDLNM